jgi:glucose/arabinose dehydrogenase
MIVHAERIASGFANPTFAATPPGDPGRLFVTEQNSGRIVILDLATRQVAAQPFFDIADSEISTGGERGLLGMAFHPDYATNGKLYLNLTNEDGDTEIWEILRSGPDTADPASVRTLLTIDRTNPNHNGGWLGFGPDGFLYIGSGDSGAAFDPENAAQNLDDLRGKILRIDVNGDDFPGDAARNYAIPSDNPFVGTAGADEVFHFGLRNPWRASFDSSGALYIGDVGQGAREEIDFLPANTAGGVNFGWRMLEGTLPTGQPQLGNPAPNDPSLRPPIAEYGRSDGISVTGGYVYEQPGSANGHYFFGDFGSGNLWTLRTVNGEAADFIKADVIASGGSLDNIASFAVDDQNQLYAVDYDGEIYELTAEVGSLPRGRDDDDGFLGLGDEAGALLLLGGLALGFWFF